MRNIHLTTLKMTKSLQNVKNENAHCRTWNMPRKQKITENEKYTSCRRTGYGQTDGCGQNGCTNFTHNYLSLFCNKKGTISGALIWVITISTNTDAGSGFFGHNHRTVGDIACPLIAFLENLKLQSDASPATRHINNCTVTTGNGPFSFSGCD